MRFHDDYEPNKDYYSILGVSEQSTPDEIKDRFRFLNQAFHPNKFASGKKDKAEEEFKCLGIPVVPGTKSDQEDDDFEVEV